MRIRSPYGGLALHCVLLGVVLCMPRTVCGLDNYWIGATGDWFDTTNWSLGALPDYDGSGARIDNGGTAQISSGDAGARYLTLGFRNTGNVTQSGGTCSIWASLWIGEWAGAAGVYELSGTGILSVHQGESIGFLGTGRFIQTGGTNSSWTHVYLGYHAGSHGTYELSGGWLDTAYLAVGFGDTGVFSHTGGTVRLPQSSSTLYIGHGSGSDGTYELSGTGVLSISHSTWVGVSGSGTFVQNGGTHSIRFLSVGYGSEGDGSYELSDGQLSVSGHETIGLSGTGSFAQSGGTNTMNDHLYIGYQSGAEGSYTMSGGQLSVSGDATVGPSGTGHFTQTAGIVEIDNELYIGYKSGSQGSYAISGGQLNAGSLYVGYRSYDGSIGTGTFKVTGDDSAIDVGSYTQAVSGTLESVLDSGGISSISVNGSATLSGVWNVEDVGAPPGTFYILEATGGISGSFATVDLPGPDWSWGIDGGTLWVQHTPENTPPVADAGPEQLVYVGDLATLDGSGSMDPDGDLLTYDWSFETLPEGSTATLVDPSSIDPTFAVDVEGTYLVRLVVNDGIVDSEPDTVTISAITKQTAALMMVQEAIGTIDGFGPEVFKNPNNKKALANKLYSVIDKIEDGEYQDALEKLKNDVLKKMDGCALTGNPDKNDWIIDCDSQRAVYPLILEVIELLQELTCST